MRLQKFISNSGYCSRRKAEDLIKKGKVKVNGKISLDFLDVNEEDKIEIEGEILKEKEKVYLKLNKPMGFVCTARKFKNEKSVFELLPEKYKNLKIGGRLDKNSEGLLLFSNDGDFILRSTHPRYESEKEYEVEFDKDISKEIISNWSKGGFFDGESFKKCKIKKQNPKKILIILSEGKKRQIRRIANHFGLNVKNLKRIRINKIKLENLKSGEFNEINPK